MKKIAMAIHGGAGPDSPYIQKNIEAYRKGLETALNAGFAVLKKNGSAVDAIETSIRLLEDNELFNAGRGSALNEAGEVEMCASIMNGKDLSAGATAILKQVRNPIGLARAIMEQSRHIYLGAGGAEAFAQSLHIPMESESYFITTYQQEQFEKARQEKESATSKKHGTVGAVALDSEGNLAAGTSTGGLEFCSRGRIADSSMIGTGCYANNQTCAISTTGEGEVHMQQVTAFHIAALMEYKGFSLEQAAQFLIHQKCAHIRADMGLIGADRDGNLVAVFNTERMHRGMRSSLGKMVIDIYPGVI